MAADSRLMKRALERFREDKERREAEHRRQVAEIYQKVPRAEEITRELRSTIGGIVAAAFRNGTDPQSAIRALKEHNLSLQRERAELLVEHGYAYDALEDKPRCALCGDPYSAEMTRRHNDANMLAMGAGIIGPNMAERIVDVFLNTQFEGGRHARRVGLMMDIEKE